MMRANYNLVRYADDWVITCRDAETARRALDFATHKLAELHLSINTEETRIISFEEGLEFLGYKFDPFLLTATPPPASTQPVVKVLLNEASAALRDKAFPALSEIGKQIYDKGKNGAHRATDFIRKRM